MHAGHILNRFSVIDKTDARSKGHESRVKKDAPVIFLLFLFTLINLFTKILIVLYDKKTMRRAGGKCCIKTSVFWYVNDTLQHF